MCNSIIVEILDIINCKNSDENSRSVKQEFRDNKRPSSWSTSELEIQKKCLKRSCECEDKVLRLEEELFLLSENLKFVTEEKDRLKAIAESSRIDAESLSSENQVLTLSNSEMSLLVEEQSKACLDMMSMMMEFLWSVSSNAITHVQFSRFLNFVIKLVSQLTGETDSNEEKRILYSVLGCLVNLSSSKEILSILTSVDNFVLLVEKLAALLSSNCDKKMILTTMMFIQNILSADFIFKERISFLKESSRESLLKVVGGVLKSENCKKSKLYQVALALNDTLLNEDREK